MEIIRKAITCKICTQILESPVVLPCGESICEKHIDSMEHEISCRSCGKAYYKDEFRCKDVDKMRIN